MLGRLLGEDPDLESSCVLTETRGDETRRLPPCETECADEECRASFALPDGVDACVGWLSSTWTSQECIEPGLGGQAIIVRPEESWERLEYQVTCATEF